MVEFRDVATANPKAIQTCLFTNLYISKGTTKPRKKCGAGSLNIGPGAAAKKWKFWKFRILPQIWGSVYPPRREVCGMFFTILKLLMAYYLTAKNSLPSLFSFGDINVQISSGRQMLQRRLADMRKMPCSATYISVLQLAMPVRFTVSDRTQTVLRSWRVWSA